ncbi:hypothetical protein COCMIDRAFT_110869 [Bipolaris oryzae ATCC 44560]|uniref:Ketopantoate reductase N-terminal domain-containing protein n=1 Tax=Bipolaris oryzae ATCC 44560 TaxID=930090 RepID=W6YPY9_COCMI|nr:uncharacterized protein COCMIDRAFT_110869 [Bipolaris oryzae ATCC 44560]EUC39670.1 hypothetical protein COCMIDRAFT_110869 [Bipolaris oryzae ATCC 44560]
MAKPKVLVIGCGATGLTHGYQFSAGNEVTFLVRPGRKSASLPPKKIYNYEEDTLHTFSDYRVIESTAEVQNTEFFLVFNTLDMHTARSESGAATLRSVGDMIRGTSSFLVHNVAGPGMLDFYADTMGIPKDRHMLALSMLAHQPTTKISFPERADKAVISQADMLYRPHAGGIGLIAFKSKAHLDEKLSEVYSHDGRLKVLTVPGFLEAYIDVAMVQTTAWFVDGFHPLDQFRSNTMPWELMVRAQRDVFSLPKFGWLGWVLRWLIGSWVTEKYLFRPLADLAAPFPMHEFQSFHHGGKVVQQDLEYIKGLVEEGKKAGRKMLALEELATKVEKKLAATITEERKKL